MVSEQITCHKNVKKVVRVTGYIVIPLLLYAFLNRWMVIEEEIFLTQAILLSNGD